jgi:DNA-binding XRE family transcriptional regulator
MKKNLKKYLICPTKTNIMKLEVVLARQKGGENMKNNLQKLRIEKGRREGRKLTQKEVAPHLGITDTHLSHLETHSKPLKLEVAVLAKHYYKVGLDEIFLDENCPVKTNKEHKGANVPLLTGDHHDIAYTDKGGAM